MVTESTPVGERTRSWRQRRTARNVDVGRAETAEIRRLNVRNRGTVSRFQTAFLLVAMAGLAWPVGLNIFATIRGELTHPPVGHGKYRFARVVTGWPDFTAPWPIPLLLIAAVITVTAVLLRRHRNLVPHLLFTMNFAWVTVGGGITFVGFMYYEAPNWPLWQAWLGIPVLITGGILWLLNRRREDHLISTGRRQ